MDFVDLVRKRYSLRKYSDFPVAVSVVDKCLEAARLAPSACNSQPWNFIVASTPEKVEPLARAAFSGVYSMNSFAAAAPVLIVALTERSRYSAALGGFFRGVQFSLMDVAIACEHISLQAAELGLGTCMFGWLNEKAVKKELNLPASAKIDLMMSMGYPEDEDFLPPKRRKNLDEIRRFL
jgi:nitroreductase